jgi:hypothetical protein
MGKQRENEDGIRHYVRQIHQSCECVGQRHRSLIYRYVLRTEASISHRELSFRTHSFTFFHLLEPIIRLRSILEPPFQVFSSLNFLFHLTMICSSEGN